MAAQDVILAGKHRGCTFAETLQKDPPYCHWLLAAHSLPRSLLSFRRWIKRTHGGILLVGKHRNKTFAQILSDYPEYASWVGTLESPSTVMRDFRAFLLEQEERGRATQPPAAPNATPAAKRHRGPAATDASSAPPSWECKVCFSEQISALFMPCGHLLCCLPCANLSQRCPVCREVISERIRVFPG